MDLRVKRTKTNIINAFISLRAVKPIEKITIKELSELAMINKATFYLHFKDIYDLSEEIENELIEKCIASIPEVSTLFSYDGFIKLTSTFVSQSELFNTIFSGSRMNVAIQKIDKYIKDKVFELHPDYKKDIEKNVILTAICYGCFYAAVIHKNEDFDIVINSLSKAFSDSSRQIFIK